MSPATLEEIRSLYRRGLMLQAYRLLQESGCPEELEGTPARLMAARLLAHLGADDRAHMLFYRTYRADRRSLEARYYYVMTVMRRRGPLAALRVARRRLPTDPTSDAIRAEWISLEGSLLASLRDFDRAHARIDEADAIAPNRAWILVERADLLIAEDRYEEALQALEQCLALYPDYGAAVHSAAQVLRLLGRDAEALDLLETVSARTETAVLSAQLTAVQIELGRHEAASRSLARTLEQMPLIDKRGRQWAASCAFEIEYALGRYEAAATHAQECGSPYHDRIAKNIAAGGMEPHRVLLPVGFVRQHFHTCAPATLSALSAFWDRHADHLEIAEAICYDGTPHYSERSWAEREGWVTREFTVTWDIARTLIHRGVPFTLTTTGPAFAHLQAVIGYDALQGTLLIRDPYTPFVCSALGPELLNDLRPYGPRGLAMVPSDRAQLLDDIEFPCRELYDRLYNVERALKEHRRADAASEVEQMARDEPEHPITLRARRALAAYDGDVPTHLQAVEVMRRLFPEEPNLAREHLHCLRQLGRREERLQLLASLTERPLKSEDEPQTGRDDAAARSRSISVTFWQDYAQELGDDGREHGRMATLIARAMRYAPTDARNLHLLAGSLWRERRFEEATELYRFAACLDPYAEHISRSYFTASRWHNRTDEALAFLHSRFKRLGKKSALPVITLFGALEQIDRTHEGFAQLEAALALRPDDPDLLLFATDVNRRYGRIEAADALLARCESLAPRMAWLSAAARLARHKGDHAGALQIWREVATAEPLDSDARGELARLLFEFEGEAAVDQLFDALSRRFPHNAEVHRDWAQWLCGQDQAAHQIEVLRRLKEIDGADLYCRCALAEALAGEGQFDEAIAEASTACDLAAWDPDGPTTLGRVLALAGRPEEARASLRHALTVKIDATNALRSLMRLCDTASEMREALEFITAQMAVQRLFGESLFALQAYANHVLSRSEADALVRRALDERPDLWQAWSAWTDQLRETDRLEEAAANAVEATARFPLIAQLWGDLAAVRAARGDHEAERNALEQALAVRPTDCGLLRTLAHSWQEMGDIARSRALLERAIATDPLDPQTHSALAYHLWVTNQGEAAVAQVHRLLDLQPENEWAWGVLRPWSSELGRAEEADNTARNLAARRPRSVRAWIHLANVLQRPADLSERLAALDRALALDARCHEACDMKARLLASSGRYDEAIAACLPPGAREESLPSRLRARLAQIEAERGNRDLAREKLRAVVRDDPAYYDGWSTLLEWNVARKDFVGAIEAAQQMTHSRPHLPLPWGYLGYALRQGGRREEAVAALRRALELDSSYTYAAETLVDIHLTCRAPDQAWQVVETVLPHRHEGWPLTLAVRTAAARNDVPGAEVLLRELCLLPGSHSESLQRAEQAMQEAGVADALIRVCGELLCNGEAQPEVGAVWARACAGRKRWKESDRLSDPDIPLRARAYALQAWIIAAEKAKDRGRIKRLVNAHRRWAAAADRSWGAVGFGLHLLRNYKEAIEWTNDYRSRKELQPWMLLNRAIALRRLRNDDESREASQLALRLDSDTTSRSHALLLAADAALLGDSEGLQALDVWLRTVDHGALSSYYKFFNLMVQAMRSAAEPGEDSRAVRERFARARDLMARARRVCPTYLRDPVQSRLYERAVKRVVRDCPTFWAPLWGALHRIYNPY